jgi:hypothetical protein
LEKAARPDSFVSKRQAASASSMRWCATRSSPTSH